MATLLRFKSAAVSTERKRSFVIEPNDIVEWGGDKEARRLIDRNIADAIPDKKSAVEMGNVLGRIIKSVPADKEFEARLDDKGKTKEDYDIEAYYDEREAAVRKSQEIQNAMAGPTGRRAMKVSPARHVAQ